MAEMVDVPGIFTRNDFVSILLPGYVNVIIAVVIFRPGLLTFKDFSFDLFSTVLLIIGGPAIGITLRQFYRTAWVFYDWVMSRRSSSGESNRNDVGKIGPETVNDRLSKREGIAEWSNEYARVRLNAKPEELDELDTAEADMDFSATTALGLGLQAMVTPFTSIPLAITIGLVIGSLILFLGGYIEWSTSFGPTFNEITSRHAK